MFVGFAFAIAVIIAALLWSLDRTPPSTQVPLVAGGLISASGTFPYPDLGLTLKAGVDRQGIVTFQVIDDTTGRTLLDTPVHASTYHRWSLTIASDRSVWLYSGDIGLYAWTPDSAGLYQERMDLLAGGVMPADLPPSLAQRMER
jgi:hypothetical protein